MKRINLALLIALLICTCASKPAVNPDEVSLNTAIRQAATRMETRLGAGTKVALVNFTSPSQAFSEYVLDELSSVLVNDGILTVVDRANLDRIRQELGFNSSGEVSEKSMQEIGKMLGAQALITGSLTSIADLRRVMFKAIITETAAIVVQHPADIINDRRVQALLAQGGGSRGVNYGNASAGGQGGGSQGVNYGNASAGGQGSGGSSGGKAAAPAQAKPAGPANGTYTFFPRPQATNAGVKIEAYIDRIIVQGRYMIIYMSNVPRGMRARPAPGYWYITYNVTLNDLDNPRNSWRPVRSVDDPDGPNSGQSISFENVTARRFSLECDWYGQNIFEEIIIPDRPDE